MKVYVPNSPLRPCLIDDMDKALFHTWFCFYDVLPPSILKGGQGGGQITHLFGIIEYENGTVRRVAPERITFCDNKTLEFEYPTDGSEEVIE